MPKTYDLAIIGGGPAGLTAGIYAGRARLNTIMFDTAGGGGMLATTERVENCPGYPDGITGPELAQRFIDHAKRFGMEIEMTRVEELVANKDPKVLKTSNGVYTSHTVLVCTGSSPRYLHVPGEERLMGRGVSYCATCDAAFFEGQEVAVVGGGNSAVDEALSIARYASKVYIIHRRDELRAEQILQDRAYADPKVEFILNSVVEQINGDDSVSGLTLRNTITTETNELKLTGVFVFIGHIPNSDFLKGQLRTDEHGYLITDDQQETSVKGIWAAGEVQDPFFRQLVTAAGEGAAAAISIDRYLKAHFGTATFSPEMVDVE